MRRAIHSTGLVLVLVLLGCSKPDLSKTTFSCRTSADCNADTEVCGIVDGVSACVPKGAASSAIRVGMSGPLQGTSADLGIEMKRGINSLFQSVNDEGGVNGRTLELDARNDNYDPDMAVENTRRLLDVTTPSDDPNTPDMRGTNSVLALLGNVGTPTMLATAPIATKNGVVFFAPFTGAQKYLRDGTTNSPYVFNYRAGYYEETEAMVQYLMTFRTPRIISKDDDYRHILAFTQRDTYGDAGYNGFVLAYNKLKAPVPQPDSTMPNPSIMRIYYERENLDSVDQPISDAETYLTGVLADAPAGGKVSVAVLMIDTYGPGNKFIRAIKDWMNMPGTDRASKLDVLFIHVSFVSSDALAKALTAAPDSYVDATDASGQTKKKYAEGVMVTQVVPYYQSQAPGVTAYRTHLAKYEGTAATFTSLEGYIAARLFVEALKAAGSAVTETSLVDALNTKIVNLDIGIGTLLNFSSVNHQACHTVWGSVIGADGKFNVPFIWDPTNGIVPGSS
jgi:ABC-type branched-subunit amino acid transport system substrate-binding protein